MRFLFLVFAAGACFGTPLAVGAQSSPKSLPWFETVTVNAFAESSYSYNFEHPNSGANALRVFDFDDHTLKIDEAELVVQRPASTPGDFGFRFDATVGDSVPEVTASYGMFRDTRTGKAHHYDLHQVFVSWVAPVGRGLKLDFGKFITPFGYEVIDGYDGYNDNETRSFLFGYSIPFTHTGVRAGYSFTEKVAVSAMIVQGWDDWRDNNGTKSFIVQAAFTPSSKWSLYLNAMEGPEQMDNNRNKRHLYNAVTTFKVNDSWTFGLNVVYGAEQGILANGRSASWSGVAGYAKYDFTDAFALAFRAEVFSDKDGTRTGTRQTLKEITVTPEFKLNEHFVLRGDLRHDWSSEHVFEKRADPVSDQTTAIIALLFIY